MQLQNSLNQTPIAGKVWVRARHYTVFQPVRNISENLTGLLVAVVIVVKMRPHRMIKVGATRMNETIKLNKLIENFLNNFLRN